MTRRDFLDNITTWWELIDFCRDEECDICDDIVDEDGRDEEVEEDLADNIRNTSWKDILHWLNDIPTGGEYYRRDGMFDYVEMDNYGDFDEYKDEVLEWMDDGNYWDDDEEEDEDEGEEELEDSPFDEESEADAEDDEEDLFDEAAFLEVIGKVV